MDARKPARRPESERLEGLWAGEFGNRYSERNADAGGSRKAFWASLIGAHPADRVLEVGCNTGANLQWITKLVAARDVVGVDVNENALQSLRGRLPAVNAIWSVARDLPFRDAWFDLSFTTGVLIHQSQESLLAVMAEIVRVSRKYVLCGEYYSPVVVEVPYHGQAGALFKRDYGQLYLENFPDLVLVDNGFLGHQDGWDDVTWWLFEKQST
jgi:pseudaminic acid biosynthesis-associated methylase